MLTRWTLENFKPIRELDLRTKPLTVLAGLNSAGKSSFLQSILLIWQTLASEELDKPLVLDDSLVPLGTFADVCNDRAEQKSMKIGFTLKPEGASWRDLGPVDVDLQLAPSTRAGGVSLPSARLSVSSCSVELSNADDQLVYVARVTEAGGADEHEYRTRAAHFLPRDHHRDPMHLGASSSASRGATSVRETFAAAIRYVGPLRVDPTSVEQHILRHIPARNLEAIGVFGARRDDDVGVYGECAAAVYAKYRQESILWWNPMSDRIESALLEEAMDAWLRYLGVADHVSSRDAGRGVVRWMVRSGAQTDEHPLQAVGFGVSQVLPILVSGLVAPPGTIHVMEQPELHLHERPQARLADFFYGLTLVGKQVFVETHSAVLINQLRYLMVKRGQEARDAIAIYFVERDEHGDARFEPIRIGKGGAIENWPDGFFDESFRQEDRITAEGLRVRGKRESA
jgi:predicted ATPase